MDCCNSASFLCICLRIYVFILVISILIGSLIFKQTLVLYLSIVSFMIKMCV